MKLARDLPIDLQTIGVVNHLMAPAMIVTADLSIAHCNAAFAELIAEKPENLQYRPVLELLEPSAQAGFKQNLDTTFQTYYPMRSAPYQLCFHTLKNPQRSEDTYFVIATKTDISTVKNLSPLENVINNLPIGISAVDLTTKVRFQSDMWRKMRGLEPEDMSRNKRKDWIKFIHPEDRTKLDRLADDILEIKGNTFAVTYRERHADGRWIAIQCDGIITGFDRNGRPSYVAAQEIDITERLADRARPDDIVRLEHRWKVAVETSGIGLWDYDIRQGKRFNSNSWYKMRGLPVNTENSLDHDTWIDTIHPFDKERLLLGLRAVQAGETDKISQEYRECHQEGHWIWILSRGQIVERASDGTPTRIVGSDTDITDIKVRAEESVTVAKSLELAVTTARIGVWEFHIATGIEKWDRQMYEIYGLDPNRAEVPKNHWELTIHRDDREEAIQAGEDALRTGEDFNLDYRIVRADGTVRHIRSCATHFDDPIVGAKLIGVNWDITTDFENASELREAHKLAQAQNKALEVARAEMEYNSFHDALTGLPNRRKLDIVRKKAEVDRFRESDYVAVLQIDLDRFKEINDNWGHGAGDAVLCHVADILRDSAPDDALVARVGGDEFLVFLEDGPNEFALAALAEEMIQAASIPMVYEGHELRFGLSVGIARAPVAALTRDNVFAHADLALYKAKDSGRGQHRFYNEGLKKAALSNRQCADDILAGLERNEFICFYQLQFDAKTLAISGVEALVRWQHPTRGLLSPDKFLDVAAQLNVVARIDRVVLENAIFDAQKWAESGATVPRVAVNVSAQRLADPLLSVQLGDLELHTNGIAFELLESVFLDDYDDQLSRNLAMIRKLGIELEVDDFGTGHASIVGLLKLQPDRLKIDRQLVKPVTTSSRQRLLVKSIIEIGRLQGIAVVAEGVETKRHADVMRELGCDHLQGFGLARPMPAADILEMLNAAPKFPTPIVAPKAKRTRKTTKRA